jgi:hypothetical protein
VLAFGVVFAVVSLGGSTVEPDPATTLAPTTTVAPVINVEDGAAALIGQTWTVVDGRSFSRPTKIEIADDGTYRVFDAGRPVDTGVTTTNADVITFQSAPTDEVTWVQNDVFLRVTDSCEGVVGEYQVVFATPSRVTLQVISDGCPPRVGVANGLQLEPAQP